MSAPHQQDPPDTTWFCEQHGRNATLCCDDAIPVCGDCGNMLGHGPNCRYTHPSVVMKYTPIPPLPAPSAPGCGGIADYFTPDHCIKTTGCVYAHEHEGACKPCAPERGEPPRTTRWELEQLPGEEVHTLRAGEPTSEPTPPTGMSVADELWEALCDLQEEYNCWCDSRDDRAPSHSPACARARRAVARIAGVDTPTVSEPAREPREGWADCKHYFGIEMRCIHCGLDSPECASAPSRTTPEDDLYTKNRHLKQVHFAGVRFVFGMFQPDQWVREVKEDGGWRYAHAHDWLNEIWDLRTRLATAERSLAEATTKCGCDDESVCAYHLVVEELKTSRAAYRLARTVSAGHKRRELEALERERALREALGAIDADFRTRGWSFLVLTINGFEIRARKEGYSVAKDVFSEWIADGVELKDAVRAALATPTPSEASSE